MGFARAKGNLAAFWAMDIADSLRLVQASTVRTRAAWTTRMPGAETKQS
jgi:hypothetical protein